MLVSVLTFIFMILLGLARLLIICLGRLNALRLRLGLLMALYALNFTSVTRGDSRLRGSLG
jgi:hypothetical protein